MKTRNTVLLYVTLSAALLLSACSKSETATGATVAVPTKASLRLAWVYDMAEVGVFVAKDRGYYAKEGIDLEIKPGGFGLDPFKLVASGSDDFGVGGAVNLLLAREKDIPVVAIGAEFQDTPVGFVTRQDSGIRQFADFKGKRVGIQTGADTDTLYRALLNRTGMTNRDLIEVPIQYDAVPFVSRQIDVLPGYVTNQPITLKNQGIATNVITAASQGLNVYGNVFFVSEKTLQSRGDLVQRFVRATTAGWKHALENKQDAIAAIQARTKDFSASDLDAIYAAVRPFIQPRTGEVLSMEEKRWAETYDLLTRAGLSTKPVSVRSAYVQVGDGKSR